jgi:CheY-like chemotaxis protein
MTEQETPKPIIIYVEDNEDVQQAICRLLKREYGNRLEVLAYDTGEKALAKFEELKTTHPPAAIVTDNNLGAGITGTELVRAIRQADKSVPIFMLSGSRGIEEAANNAGVTRFFDKDNYAGFIHALKNLIPIQNPLFNPNASGGKIGRSQ